MRRRPLVLVVDDEADIASSMQGVIETELGFTVLTATSAKAALLILDALGPDEVDLVMSDFRMPEMDGLEFLQRARRGHPSTPRVLVTAHADLDLAINALNAAGVARFITKPFEAPAFTRAVAELVASNVARRQRAAALRRVAGPAGQGGDLA